MTFAETRRDIVDSIMAARPFYTWLMKYAEKREEEEMKTAMYRMRETEDFLILAPSKDIEGLRCVSPMAASSGNLAGKAYLLPTMLQSIMVDKWLIAKDDLGRLCLIPRRKKVVIGCSQL